MPWSALAVCTGQAVSAQAALQSSHVLLLVLLSSLHGSLFAAGSTDIPAILPVRFVVQVPFDLAQCSSLHNADRWDMKPPRETCPGKQTSKPLSRSEEVLRVVEEYAEELREIIKKLGKRLFH
jgi:hypothetical protein